MRKVTHLVLDLEGTRNCPFIENPKDVVEQFLLHCVKLTQMQPLTDPILRVGNPHNPGVSGIIMIDTSHIAIHQFAFGNQVRIDVYSCKPFDADTIEALTEIYFPADLVHSQIIERKPVHFPGTNNEYQ